MNDGGPAESSEAPRADVEVRLPASVWSTEIGFWEWIPATDTLRWLNDWPVRVGVHPCDGERHVEQLMAIMDPEHHARLEPAWRLHLEGRRDRYEVEYRVRDVAGEWRWLAMRARIVERAADGTPGRMVGAAFDVDERHRLQDAVARGRNQFAAASAALPVWVMLTDEQRRIEFSSRGTGGNGGGEDLVGLDAMEVPGLPDPPAFAAWHGAVVAERQPVQYRCTDPATARVHEVRMAPALAGSSIVGVATSIADVSDRAQLERKILEVESQGRRRIGADLHEGLGQQLAGIAYSIAGARRIAAGGQRELVPLLDRVLELIEGAIGSTRDASRGMSPVGAAQGGLVHALRELCRSRTLASGARIDFSAPPGLAAPAEPLRAEHLYGIARDALDEALHRGARSVQVAVEDSDGMLSLTVCDQLQGTPAPAEGEVGQALRLMQYRAEQLGGSLRVERVPTGGTMLLCRCPSRMPQPPMS
ncbi:MAG: PAS domain-containing protein [Steroidobacteraceae bacterium]|jgi:signal transduction histidine kinase|nr:PAS domain-containing protein [Steroidobacteraceae bacterium]